MVVGFNSDVTATRNTGYKQFGILLLKPLLAGETLNVTDDGWNAAQQKFLSMSTHTTYSWNRPDSHRSYTATTTRPAGTVLTSDDFGAALGLSTWSDQLLVYQGPQTHPGFICALDNSGGTTISSCPGSTDGAVGSGWRTSSCSNSYWSGMFSDMPLGLSWPAATNFSHQDNWGYTSSVTAGTADQLRTLISRSASWSYDTWRPTSFRTSFTVYPDPPSAPPPPAPPAPPPSNPPSPSPAPTPT